MAQSFRTRGFQSLASFGRESVYQAVIEIGRQRESVLFCMLLDFSLLPFDVTSVSRSHLELQLNFLYAFCIEVCL